MTKMLTHTNMRTHNCAKQALTQDTYKDTYKDTCKDTHAHTFAKQAFTQYDKDGSGAIDRCFVFRSIFIV